MGEFLFADWGVDGKGENGYTVSCGFEAADENSTEKGEVRIWQGL